MKLETKVHDHRADTALIINCGSAARQLFSFIIFFFLWYLPGALLSAVCCIFLFDGRVCVHLQAFPFHGLVDKHEVPDLHF